MSALDESVLNKKFQLYLITDPDNQSSSDNSELLIATLDTSVPSSDDRFVEFEKLYQVGSKFRTVTRTKSDETKLDGDEYSDLIRHEGKLLTCCDATGIIFWVDPEIKCSEALVSEDEIATGGDMKTKLITARPQHIITHEDGTPMKLEWMTSYPSGVAGKNHLLMGGHGTTDHHREVFILNALNNKIESHNWSPFYDTISLHLNVKKTGYVVNEAIVFSPEHQCLIVAPRVISKTAPFTPKVSYENGCGKILLLSCTNNKSFKVDRTIVLEDFVDKDTNDNLHYNWGFSAIQSFGKNHFIGVQTRERPDSIPGDESEAVMNSRLVMFNMEGKMLGAPVVVGGPNVLFEFENRKIEGLWIDM